MTGPIMPLPVMVALGANLSSAQGGPRETLEAALSLLQARGVSVLKQSRWFVSPAWPAGAGPDYVNGAALVETAMTAQALMQGLHKTEKMLGRERSPDRWEARSCDLDLLCYGAAVMPGLNAWRRIAQAPPDTPRSELFLPHPQLHRRAFVLAPLADIAPGWRHPVLGKTVREMLETLPANARQAVRAL